MFVWAAVGVPNDIALQRSNVAISDLLEIIGNTHVCGEIDTMFIRNFDCVSLLAKNTGRELFTLVFTMTISCVLINHNIQL